MATKTTSAKRFTAVTVSIMRPTRIEFLQTVLGPVMCLLSFGGYEVWLSSPENYGSQLRFSCWPDGNMRVAWFALICSIRSQCKN